MEKPDMDTQIAHLVFVGVSRSRLSTRASSDNGCFPFLSSEAQITLGSMDDSGTYMNVKFTKTDSRSPSGDEPEVSYAELNVKSLSAPRVRTYRDDLKSTYSELTFQKEETRIDEDEVPPLFSGPGGLSTLAHTGAHKQEPKPSVGNRSHHKICLFCLVTSILAAIVAGLSVYVSQIRHSLTTCDREHHKIWEQYQEMNRTQRQCHLQVDEFNSSLESSITENSRLALSRSTCLQNISVLNNKLSTLESKLFVLENENSALSTHLSDLTQTETDLRQNIRDLEIKHSSLIKEKDQICQLLTSGEEPTCSRNWIRNKHRCYFISTIHVSYAEAKQHCSSFDSRLLEINSNDEASAVYNSVQHGYWTYWIGKCVDGKVESNLLYTVKGGKTTCTRCKSYGWNYNCQDGHYFICEKSAPLFPDVLEKIRYVCQEPVG